MGISRIIGPLVLKLVAVLTLAAAVGCAHNPVKSYFGGATATMKASTMLNVQDALIAVFEEKGYRLASDTGSSMTFEKAGTLNDDLMYAVWKKNTTTQRAKVEIEREDDERYRVICSAVIVRDVGGMHGEEIGLLPANGRWRFQSILDTAKKRLKREADSPIPTPGGVKAAVF